MAEPKTKRTNQRVEDYLDTIADAQKKHDCEAIVKMMRGVTRAQPAMWGESIIGFGTYKQKYASGAVAEWPIVAFSPRKLNITIYLMTGFERSELMQKLGKYKTGKVCLYIQRLADVDAGVLRALITETVKATRAG